MAARAGVQPGDVIIEYAGQPVASSDLLVQMVADTKPGTTITLSVLRDRQPLRLTVNVASLDVERERARR